MQTTFEFNTDAIPLIIREIALAKKYVRIAMFQIHREAVFNTLTNLLANKVQVEILTLPYDSINEDVRPQVEARFRQLAKNGAIIYFDKWNVGDPLRLEQLLDGGTHFMENSLLQTKALSHCQPISLKERNWTQP